MVKRNFHGFLGHQAKIEAKKNDSLVTSVHPSEQSSGPIVMSNIQIERLVTFHLHKPDRNNLQSSLDCSYWIGMQKNDDTATDLLKWKFLGYLCQNWLQWQFYIGINLASKRRSIALFHEWFLANS